MHLQNKGAKIFVAGHRGLVGSAIVSSLRNNGFSNLLLRTHQELDLCDEAETQRFFETEQPDFVILAAAKVGGILANASTPADFLVQNLRIATNVIRCAAEQNVQRLVFLGSSCIYPKLAPQPLQETSLLSGYLEPTNEWYAIAKITGIKLCQAYHKQFGNDFLSLMPTNLYGIGDNFDLHSSHVLPALLRKFHEAKGANYGNDASVVVWGTGTPQREFLHSHDLADACLFVLQQPETDIEAVAPDRILNVGHGKEIEIRALAELIRGIVGSDSEIIFDTTKPDGTPRKVLDTTRLTQLGWKPKIGLREGIEEVYKWYCLMNNEQ